MSKNSRLLGLAVLGALLVAGTVFWKQNTASRAIAGEAVDVSGGPSTDKGTAYFPPAAVRHDVMKNLSTALMGGALTEPPPSFQAVQPQPPGPLVAAAKQGLRIEKQSTTVSASLLEPAMEAPRDVAKASLAALAIEAPRHGTGIVPFAFGSREAEGLRQRPLPPQLAGFETKVAPIPVPPSQHNADRTNSVSSLSEEAGNDLQRSAETTLEASGSDAGDPPEDDGATSTGSADQVVPANEQLQPRLAVDEDGIPESRSSHSVAATEGHEKKPDNQLASKAFDFSIGTTPTGRSVASEPEKVRETAHADTPAAVSHDTAIHIERLLDRLGFDPGPIDGVVGPMTLDAIVWFQKEHGREITREIDDQLTAALENKLFESFRHHLERSLRQERASPGISPTRQPPVKAESPPSGTRKPENSVTIYNARSPARQTQSQISTSEAPKSGARAEKPAMRIGTPEEARPLQQVRLEARTERIEEKVPNPFEACALSGNQREYIKTESGFVLCEEFSFDAEIRR